ncbi:MAG: Flp pilus assembly complex ATPase component TadA [Planctomycetes bacterium]|nr:Flp pilus assembly complex ATPase component TadA [Planctomycetota bacterium]
MITSFDKKINNILLRTKTITQEKSAELIEAANKENKSFADAVIDKQVLDENALLALLAVEVKIPPLITEKIATDEKILAIIPEDKANHYNILPLSKISNILTIAVADPFDVVKLDDIRLLTKCDLRMTLVLERHLKEAIKRAYNPDESHKIEEMVDDLTGEMGGPEIELSESEVADEKIDMSQITGEASDSPVIKLVNMLIFRALREGASDIHIEPYEKKVRVRFRMDGVLHEAFLPPKRLHNAIASRIKIMSALDISERRVPQDGKFQIKFEGRRIDFRVAVVPTVHGERVVMRILDSSSLNLKLDDLGFEEVAHKAFQKAINASYGMVLVSGPTGSGKTTTLYCAVKETFNPEENLITVEDPVEYQLPGILQVPVNPKQGMTFGAALRSILRQDPDIIMIGEMRDLETADIAIKAAITGHLVFSTLHTNDSVSTVSRLIDMGIDPFMVSSAVLLVANQRLLRKLCSNCKTPAEIPEKDLLAAGVTKDELGKATFFKQAGCPRCAGGYKGRAAIYEVLDIDDEVRRMVVKGASLLEIRDYAVNKLSMLTIRRAGLRKAMQGLTSLDEVLRNT